MKVRAVILVAILAAFLSLMGCLYSARLLATGPPSILLSELQIRSQQSASEEFIELSNQSNAPVSIQEWKIEYLTASGTASVLVELRGLLAAGSSLLISKAHYLADADVYFSKNLSDTGGHIRVLAARGDEVDRLGWGTATQPEGKAAPTPDLGQSLQRRTSAGLLVDSNNNLTDFMAANPTPVGGGGLPQPPDDSEDPNDPNDPEDPDEGPTATSPCKGVVLSEILANPGGADSAGGEFIELYNPTEEAIPIADCLLRTDKMGRYTFAAADQVLPGTYTVLQLADKLLNTSGTVTFATADTEEIVAYPAMQDDEAWAIVAGAWQKTNRPTPGAPNSPSSPHTEEPAEPTPQTTVGCPEGKFRNPETNRCKNITDASTATISCKVGQVRNPSTNRCRTIVSSTLTSAKPCAADQERNPITKRCRKVVTAATSACPAGQARNPETNRCRKIPQSNSGSKAGADSAANEEGGHRLQIGALGSVGALVVGYSMYEYRQELQQNLRRLRQWLLAKLPGVGQK